jgi:hypothetical protein
LGINNAVDVAGDTPEKNRALEAAQRQHVVILFVIEVTIYVGAALLIRRISRSTNT